MESASGWKAFSPGAPERSAFTGGERAPPMGVCRTALRRMAVMRRSSRSSKDAKPLRPRSHALRERFREDADDDSDYKFKSPAGAAFSRLQVPGC